MPKNPLQKILAKMLIAAPVMMATSAHALVLKCEVANSGRYILTNAQFCPSGTTFVDSMPGDNPYISSVGAGAYRQAQPSVDCAGLRRQRDAIKYRLDHNLPGDNLLDQLRAVNNTLNINSCRI
ncbi:MAG TPA: hypothetical protein VJ642_10985 [Chromobacteriaceae bacterium]|nr:hypothetical protein [Chromobacteriaceae bacterium]